MSKACIFMANGCEEVEALTVVDLLRRAAIEITMVSVTGGLDIVGRSGIAFKADALYEDVSFEEADLLVLPGGMPGTTTLGDHKALGQLLKEKAADGSTYIGAICAAPMVLGALGLLEGKNATIYPGMEEELVGAKALTEKVVKDDRIITSRGVGTAIDFALCLITCLEGAAKAEEVAHSIVFQ
ncbi:MAG: DJ-1/PfpI family protein [Lachnospiraceae bacterium]|nr:DJ-1/PfpI family protein [Lachnospiraceae bacterium]